MSVSPRGNAFEVYVKWTTEANEQKRIRVSAKTQAQGEAMEREIRECIAKGRPIDLEVIKLCSTSGKKTLREAIDLTVAVTWRGNKSVDTSMLNATLCARVLGVDRAIDSIDHEDIDSLVAAFQAEGNSDSTINKKMSALRQVFELAKVRGWVANPPALPHTKELNGRIRYLMDGEEEALLDMTRRISRDDFADLWVFLIDTGARVGEALKLTWADVTQGRATFWDTKNNSPRTVPMTQRLVAMMARRRNQGRPFPMTYPEARHVWDRVKGLLKLSSDDQWVIHMLRHTCASRLVQRGVPLLVVKEWMGHKAIQMTMRYAHLAPSNLDAAVAVLEPAKAPVAELVDAVGLGPTAEGHGGSSPSRRTIPLNIGVAA